MMTCKTEQKRIGFHEGLLNLRKNSVLFLCLRMGALGTCANFEQLVDRRDHVHREGLPCLPIVLELDERNGRT